MANDTRFYVLMLSSSECQCGRPKGESKALCWTCWKRLPPDHRADLYNRLGSGFEEAYEAAVKFLAT